MSPRSDGILCYYCEQVTGRVYWNCYECDFSFCSTYCIQEMFEVHSMECYGEIRQMKKKSTAKHDIPCRFFLLGKCKNGSACEFIHEKSQIPCEYFANGECKYGSKCVFLHSDSYAQKLKKPPEPLLPAKPAKQKKQEKPICTHFQRGICDYGDKCFKLHIKSNQPTSLNNNAKVKKPVIQKENNKQPQNKEYNQNTIKSTVIHASGDRSRVLHENKTSNTNTSNYQTCNVSAATSNTSTNNFVPTNTCDYELAMDDDEIFLSDTSSEEDEEESIKENVTPSLTSQLISTKTTASVTNKNVNEPKKSKKSKKTTKKKSEKKPKPKMTDHDNMFSMLQNGSEEGSSDSDNDKYLSETDNQLSSKSSTPQPRQLTKKEKKKMAKEQKIGDKKIIVDNLRREGNRVFQDGNVQKAVDLYTKAIMKAGANNPCYKLFNNRSAAFMTQKNFRFAHRDASKCLELDPENVKALRRIVQCCIKLGQIEEGKERLKKLVNVDKNWKSENECNPVSYEKTFREIDKLNKEAHKYFEKGSYELAEDHLDRMLKLCTHSSQFTMMKAAMAALLTRTKDAKKLVDKADTKDPNTKCSWYHFAQGLVYYFDADLNRAVSKFLLAKSDIKKAEIWHAQANQLNASFTHGKRLASEGKHEEALEAFSNSLILGEKNTKFKLVALCERAKCYLAMKDFRQADQEIARGLSTNHEFATTFSDLHLIRGLICKEKGMFTESLKHLRKAKDLQDDKESINQISAIINLVVEMEWREKREREDRERRERQRKEEAERRKRREEQEKRRKERREERREEMEKNCYYKILGVPRTADQKTIKQEFYKKAKMFHPDKHAAAQPKEKKEMEEKMKEIARAHGVLSDVQKRAHYDRKIGMIENDCYDSEDDDYYDTDSDNEDDFMFTAEMFFRFINANFRQGRFFWH